MACINSMAHVSCSNPDYVVYMIYGIFLELGPAPHPLAILESEYQVRHSGCS